MFMTVLTILIGVIILERLVKLDIYPAYKVFGTLAVIVAGLDVLLIRKAILTGTEGWVMLAMMVTLLSLFGFGFLIAYIGGREGWWK